ncbi:hypothetical protein K491DRAFT_271666 [Lophiostoma macrostomum CBS 122681]|uniref:Uncharacterized protein n=1 Tax=Lophiostoma macrostomum CBS 122681 TaxID=1314788 RepID=A0A6A6SKK8_9PLEO|nr:hypothetical protein K491DRAFT_271666 [Lophiostoma macrostomum CBS 122681]
MHWYTRIENCTSKATMAVLVQPSGTGCADRSEHQLKIMKPQPIQKQPICIPASVTTIEHVYSRGPTAWLPSTLCQSLDYFVRKRIKIQQSWSLLHLSSMTTPYSTTSRPLPTSLNPGGTSKCASNLKISRAGAPLSIPMPSASSPVSRAFIWKRGCLVTSAPMVLGLRQSR